MPPHTKQIPNSNAVLLFKVFDHPDWRSGLHHLAFEMGTHPTVLSRWALPLGTKPRGHGGKVPPKYNARILEAADIAGIPRAAVLPYLDADVCPACGQTMPEGRKL